MLTTKEFQELLRKQGVLIIDGALATELEARGQDLNHPLWSAKTLQNNPNQIEKVHLDYYLAGADIAITASYQASVQGFQEHFHLSRDECVNLIKKSVQLAHNARDVAYTNGITSDRKLLVAGSVGPYGAYLANGSEYTGDYKIPSEAMKDFHRPRIQALVDADVDILALETMPNISEIEALLTLLRDDFPNAIAWVSCTVKSPGVLSDGTPWENILRLISQYNQIVAFGINCIPLSLASKALESIHADTALPLVCYPNSGEEWDATSKTWHGTQPDERLVSNDHVVAKAGIDGISAEVNDWIANGAKLIGGCCRTGPAFIKAIRSNRER